MIAYAARASTLAPLNPIARVTSVVFGLVPAWLPLLILRLTLARPFFASGLTRWDGWFTLSFGTKILFEQDYKLHIFGAEIPFPTPEHRRDDGEHRRNRAADPARRSGSSPAGPRSAFSA